MFTGEDYKTSFVPALVIFTLAVCTVLIISQNPFFIMTFFFSPCVVFFSCMLTFSTMLSFSAKQGEKGNGLK